MMVKKYIIIQLFIFSLSQLHAQCFSGLGDTICSNAGMILLTPIDTGGYFLGDGVSGDGQFFPSIPAAGENYITYINTNYYTVDTNGVFDPLTGVGTEVDLPDDGFSEGIPLGFNFEYFGSNKTQVRIHSNGFISFNFDPAIFPPYANDIPSAGMPTDFIAVAWGDYDPTTGGTINYFSAGTAPYRKLVINFIDLPPYGGDIGNLTSQVILYETTNIIEIHTTASPDYGAEKTQGIENGDGTLGFVRPGRNNSFWESYNDYVAFIPVLCTDSTFIKSGPEITITEDSIHYCNNSTALMHAEGAEDYTWAEPFSDFINPGATDGEFILNGDFDPGTYTIYLTADNGTGCPDVDSAALVVEDCTEITEESTESKFIIFPIPASDKIEILLSGELSNGSILTVFNEDGIKVMDIKVTEKQFSVPVSGLAPGLYFATISSSGKYFQRTFAVISK